MRRLHVRAATFFFSPYSCTVSRAASAPSHSGTPPEKIGDSADEEDAAEECTYFNFSTHHHQPGAGAEAAKARRPITTRLLRSVRKSGMEHTQLSQTDFLPLYNTIADDPGNPYNHVRIFRRDMADSRGHVPLSIDVSQKKFTDMFCDYDGRRCKLCNETFVQWHTHQRGVPHAGREAMALELVRANCGTPEQIVDMWWHRLNRSKQFNRLPSLSHPNAHVRKRRLQYLLRLLVDRSVLVDTFKLQQDDSSAGRSWEFERLEFFGDNVVKYVLNDRVNCCFPISEGGIRGRLGYFQFVMDGNEGLARTYDFLELQQYVKSERVVSKFKSDVVETLFGELQFWLWSAERDWGTTMVEVPFDKVAVRLHTLVEHVMEELAHVMFLFHVSFVLGNVQRIVRENQIEFVKTDPAGGGGRGEAAEAPLQRSQPSNIRLSTARRPLPKQRHGVAGSTLAFRQVPPLGGLLPVPFAAQDLSINEMFMPHLQKDTHLSAHVSEQWGRRILQPTDRSAVAAPAPADIHEKATAPSGDGLSPSPCTPEKRFPARMNVKFLKAHDLVTELL